MADEVITEPAGIQEIVIDSDDKMFAYANELLNSAQAEKKTEEKAVETKPEDQPAEVEEKKEETAEGAPAEPQVEEKAEEKKPEPDTAKPEAKPHYTPEEIKEIAATGDFSKFDSSRLTPGEQAAVKSMQSGLTPKLQRAAEIEKNYQALLQKERELAERNAKVEAEKKYQEDLEEHGEMVANLNKRLRELETAQEAAKAERELERQAYLASQQKIAAQEFHYTFVEKAKDYGLPNTPQMEDMVMSRTLAENQARAINGEPYISVEDGMRLVADTIDFSNPQRLEDFLAANPKLREALRSKFGQEVAKAKPVGATVIKSSSGGGSGKSEVKPTAAPHDKLLDKDPIEWMVQEALSMSKNPNQ